MSAYCDPTDVANLFPMSNAAVPNTQIARLIVLASAQVENYCRRIFASQSYTESAPLIVNKHNEIVGRTRQWPITAVTALSYQYRDSTAAPIALDPALVDFDRPPARFFYWTGQGIPNAPATTVGYISRYGPPATLTYTYTAGYAPIPDDITLATALLTQALLMIDINPAGASSVSVSAEGGGGSLSFGQGNLHVKMAQQLLDPYVALGDD